MPSGKQIAAVLVAVTIGAVLMMPIMSTISENTGEVETDANFTAETDTWQELDGYSIVTDSETVEYRTNDGDMWTTADSGTDYELDEDSGDIQFLSSGNVSDGDQISMAYTYEATDSTTTTVLGIVPILVALLLLTALADRVQEGL